MTLPITPGSSFNTLVPGPNDVEVNAFLDYQTGQLFVTQISQTGPTGEVITTTGTVKAGPTAGTEYLAAALDISAFGINAPSVLAAQGITATDLSMGGGTLYSVNTSSLAATPITQNGSPYVIPAGILLVGAETSVGLFEGAGFPSGSAGSFAFLIDLNKNQILTTPASTTTELEPFY